MTSRLESWGLLTIVLAGLLHAIPAQALTICAGSCGPPGGGGTVGDEIDRTDLSDLATTGIDGLVLADGLGISLNVIGDVVVHVPSGVFAGTEITFCAGEGIQFGTPGQNVTIDVTGDVYLGSGGFCGPFESDLAPFDSDLFHLNVLSPLSSALEIYATGNLVVTSMPVPEPGTASLLAMGLVALACRGRRGSATQW